MKTSTTVEIKSIGETDVSHDIMPVIRKQTWLKVKKDRESFLPLVRE
jgi:hypothetical protein